MDREKDVEGLDSIAAIWSNQFKTYIKLNVTNFVKLRFHPSDTAYVTPGHSILLALMQKWMMTGGWFILYCTGGRRRRLAAVKPSFSGVPFFITLFCLYLLSAHSRDNI